MKPYPQFLKDQRGPSVERRLREEQVEHNIRQAIPARRKLWERERTEKAQRQNGSSADGSSSKPKTKPTPTYNYYMKYLETKQENESDNNEVEDADDNVESSIPDYTDHIPSAYYSQVLLSENPVKPKPPFPKPSTSKSDDPAASMPTGIPVPYLRIITPSEKKWKSLTEPDDSEPSPSPKETDEDPTQNTNVYYIVSKHRSINAKPQPYPKPGYGPYIVKNTALPLPRSARSNSGQQARPAVEHLKSPSRPPSIALPPVDDRPSSTKKYNTPETASPMNQCPSSAMKYNTPETTTPVYSQIVEEHEVSDLHSNFPIYRKPPPQRQALPVVESNTWPKIIMNPSPPKPKDDVIRIQIVMPRPPNEATLPFCDDLSNPKFVPRPPVQLRRHVSSARPNQRVPIPNPNLPTGVRFHNPQYQDDKQAEKVNTSKQSVEKPVDRTRSRPVSARKPPKTVRVTRQVLRQDLSPIEEVPSREESAESGTSSRRTTPSPPAQSNGTRRLSRARRERSGRH